MNLKHSTQTKKYTFFWRKEVMISIMYNDAKFLNKILSNQVNQCIECEHCLAIKINLKIN